VGGQIICLGVKQGESKREGVRAGDTLSLPLFFLSLTPLQLTYLIPWNNLFEDYVNKCDFDQHAIIIQSNLP